MNFCDAMDLLKAGAKITRQPWGGELYLKLVGNDVKTLSPQLSAYIYDENIMISDGWQILGDEKEYKFCEIIPDLQQGLKVKLKAWTDTFIYLDKDAQVLIIHKMDIFPFIPDFKSFVADDWMELK